MGIGMFKTSVDEPIAPGTTCIATGWGQTTGVIPSLPNALQVVEIEVISKEDCELDYEGYIQPGMICAGKPGAGTCSGDSGGPLVCPDANGDMKLAGLVSFGRGDCSASSVFALATSTCFSTSIGSGAAFGASAALTTASNF